MRVERRLFAGLTALAALVMAALPVIPGHDMPQHLAYLRLLVAWRDPASYPKAYDAPDLSNGYATTYRLLEPLAARTSPEIAVRVALVLYVVFLAVAVRAFVRATWIDLRDAGDAGDTRDMADASGARASAPLATTFLGPLAGFNPVLCMGFLPYVLALPWLVGSLAAAATYLRTARRRWLVMAGALGAVTAVFHLIAAAALVLFVLVLALVRRERRSAFAALSTTAGVLAGTRLAGEGPTMTAGLGDSLRANVTEHGVVDGIVATFRITSTPPQEKFTQLVAQVLGPFPRTGKAVVAAIVLVVIALEFQAWRAARSSLASLSPSPSSTALTASTAPTALAALAGVRLACAALALAALLAPGAIQVPDDICLLDFRLITTAAIVCIAAIPPGVARFAPRRLFVVASAVGLVLLLWLRQLAGAASEVTETTRLIDRLAPSDRLLALSMHDASAYLDETNGVLHYAAVYHTVRTGGVTSLFWGKFTARLPVGFRAGQEPKRPPDWSPWLVTDEQLADFSHVIIRAPQPGDDDVFYDLSARLTKMTERGDVVPIATDGACTLFRIAHRTAVVEAP